MMTEFKKIYCIYAILFVIALAGCAQPKDFRYGLYQLKNINMKYNATIDFYPNHLKQIESMSNDLSELKKIQLETGREPLNEIIDYQLLNLEAEKLFILSQKYGGSGTTKLGFGCKMRPLVIESAAFRNASAAKGFEAVDLLKKFVARYPKEAASAGLSSKNALFLNATFYQIYQEAEIDGRTITYFCQKNETLENYKKEFRRETSMSSGLINSLTYEQAVPIWKKLNELD